jgi:hypothetical protein
MFSFDQLFDFFDNMGIYIVPTFIHITTSATKGNWGYDITNLHHEYFRRRNLPERTTALKLAFERAFEMLEERLKK